MGANEWDDSVHLSRQLMGRGKGTKPAGTTTGTGENGSSHNHSVVTTAFESHIGQTLIYIIMPIVCLLITLQAYHYLKKRHAQYQKKKRDQIKRIQMRVYVCNQSTRAQVRQMDFDLDRPLVKKNDSLFDDLSSRVRHKLNFKKLRRKETSPDARPASDPDDFDDISATAMKRDRNEILGLHQLSQEHNLELSEDATLDQRQNCATLRQSIAEKPQMKDAQELRPKENE